MENCTSLSNGKRDESLSSVIYEKLRSCEYDIALQLVKCKKYETYLKHNSLDIVPIITKILLEEFCVPDTEECVEEILVYIASIANPKESLLVFLEEVEINRSIKQFRVALKPLQKILLQNVSKTAKSNSFSWVFNTVNNHVGILPLPKDYMLEGEERKLTDSDSNLIDSNITLEYILDFYSVFSSKVLSKDLIWPDKSISSGEFLSYFLLQIFYKPLTYIDIFVAENDVKSNQYNICSKFVDVITHLLLNPFKLFAIIKPKLRNLNSSTDGKSDDDHDAEDADNSNPVPQLALATYFYCLLGLELNQSYLPCIYTNEYLFFTCVPCCVYLFEEQKMLVIHKGLILLKSLLYKLDNKALTKDSLDVPNHSDILTNLVQILTYCESKECRTLALHCLKTWILKFDSSGSYQLLSTIFSTVSHSGILGVVIHELKEILKLSTKEKRIDAYFSGIRLQNILTLACSLPNGETTDLLECSDRIMSALNLLIFLCLSDSSDALNFHETFPKLNQEFLEPLENGLRISKAHYELKLKDYNNCGKDKTQKPELNVKVNGTSFSGLSPELEKEAVLHALNWFDIMQSVWARAVKLVSQCSKSNHSK